MPIEGVNALKHVFSIQFLKLYPTYIFMRFVSLPLLFIVKKYYRFTIMSCMAIVVIATLVTYLVLSEFLRMQNIDVSELMSGIVAGSIIGTLMYGYVLWLFLRVKRIQNA